MEISSKLIADFFAGRCSEEEERRVKAWFTEDPDRLKAYLTEESWDNFIAQDGSVEASAKMLRYIDRKTIPPGQSLFKWLAAASVLLVLSAGIYFLQRSPQPQLVKQELPCIISSKNMLTVAQKLVLPDGSVSMLAPGSTLTYDSGFVTGRNILLLGEASFSVAKDSTRPFCVHAKNINVTALGTMFNVADKGLQTAVTLYEGKVVIRKEANASKNLNEVFLNAGQVFHFDNNDFSYAVSRIKKNDTRPKAEIAKVEKASARVDTLHFNNQQLEEVFIALQKVYHVKIQFNTGTFKDLRFTGTHNPATETLEDFLGTIAMLNDLKVKKNGIHFFIMLNE